MSWWIIAIIVLAVGGLGAGTYFLVKYLQDKNTGTAKVQVAAVAVKASNLTAAARIPGALRATQMKVHSDCAVPTASTLCGQEVTSDFRVCTMGKDDTYLDDSYTDEKGATQYYGYVKDCEAEDGTQRVVFGPRGLTDWVRPLKNVSGEFFSMVVTAAADQYQNGFNPGEGTTINQALFDTMYAQLDSEAVVLVGAVGSLTAGATKYAFNAIAPVSHTVKTLTADEVSRLVAVTGDGTKGCFRFSAEFTDYEFDIPSSSGTRTCRLRLYINHRFVPMSTKAWGELNTVSGEWEYRLLDITSVSVTAATEQDGIDEVTGQTLTDTFSGADDPPEAWFTSGHTYLSFWNSYLIRSGQTTDEQKGEAASAAIYETNFKNKVTPMPIALIEDSVDLAAFVTGAVEIDLVVNSSISFSRLKSGEYGALGSSTTDAVVGDYILESMLPTTTGAQVGVAITSYEMNDLSFRARMITV